MTKHHVLVAVILIAASGARPARAAETTAAAATDPAASTHELTLTDALRAARAHQPALQLALGNLVTAEGQADAARAALLPQFNGVGSYTRATSNFVPQPGGTVPNGAQARTSFETNPLWRVGVTASQLVYDFGESINRWQSAHVAAEAQEEGVHVTEAQVMFNVRIAFFSARAAKDLVTVARGTLTNQERHLAEVTTLVQVGTRPEIDLTQARADRATAQLQLINAENAYAVAKATLNQAMGVERSIDYDPADDALPPVDVEDRGFDALVDEAKRLRPEMVSLRLAARSQELGLRSAHDMIWPNLGLTGTANESGPTLDRLTWNFSGLVSLSVPILQGGAIHAQIRQAEGQLVQAQAQLDTERHQVRLDVEQACLGVRAAKAAMAAAEDALANTRDRLRLAEGRYTTGIGNIIELGDAQLALTTTAAQSIQARYQLYTARAQLLKALGRS